MRKGKILSENKRWATKVLTSKNYPSSLKSVFIFLTDLKEKNENKIAVEIFKGIEFR
jgi:hypothetical protein